jgi:signal peptidase I
MLCYRTLAACLKKGYFRGQVMRLVREIISWLLHLAIAFVLAFLISMFVFQPTYVEGRSMESTLHDQDKVFISKLIHTLNGVPGYGDIVVIDSRVARTRTLSDDLLETIRGNLITQFIFGLKPDQNYWIKRVIGKPGDVLVFEEDRIMRNGELLIEPYVKEPAQYYSLGTVVVPEGHIFVMGDNRNHSRDSREIGCIPLTHVIGKYKFTF